ncbi:MAG: pyridoxal phosphate-dependent aminotransferase [Candidatus Parabeggiatoa sp.]|nr:pyridoxal phosphate-dependent aminotransferase [Candidatus Parabeggiatoa sp.]
MIKNVISNKLFTLQFYRDIRKYNCPDNSQIGLGVNHTPPFHGINTLLQNILVHLFKTNNVAYYPRPGGEADERKALSGLLNLYLGSPIFKPEHIIVTNGSSEGIDIVCKFAAKRGLSALLPLPAYFQYEYAAVENNLPLNGYYNTIGETFWTNQDELPLVFFINSPDAITGKFQSLAFFEQIKNDSGNNIGFMLFDLCYQMMDIDPNVNSQKLASQIATDADWSNSAMLLTASKDISLPALRSGLIVSKNIELLSVAKDTIMKRYFSVSPICYYLMLIYLALAILFRTETEELAIMFTRIQSIFAQCNLYLPDFTIELVNEFRQTHCQMLEHFKQNLNYLLFDFHDIFDINSSIQPQAGFSCFLKLRNHIKLSAVKKMAHILSKEYKLNVYPSYTFCGTPHIWETLYPQEVHLRVNISPQHEQIFHSMNKLRKGLKKFAM